MEDLMLKLGIWVAALIAAIPVIVTAANVITLATPTKVDDRVWGKIAPYMNAALKVLNWAALNVFKNKNADEVKLEEEKAKAEAEADGKAL